MFSTLNIKSFYFCILCAFILCINAFSMHSFITGFIFGVIIVLLTDFICYFVPAHEQDLERPYRYSRKSRYSLYPSSYARKK